MNRIWPLSISIFALILIIILSFFLYKNTEELNKYKEENATVMANYMNLQKKLDGPIDPVVNFRQVNVLARTSDSINLQVGEIINKYAQKVKGNLSIYFKNMATGESVELDVNRKYYMASLYKVILVLYLLDETDNLNTTLGSQVGTSGATLELALDKIITESNNEYATMLAEQYGWVNIESTMKEKLGIDFSFGEDLQATAKNIGLLFEEIALAQNISEPHSDYMLDLLQNQTIRSKLPKYLPSSIRSHNKTGELDEYSHDAGIFYTPSTNYILVFMSMTENPDKTNEQMALMSKEIFEILN